MKLWKYFLNLSVCFSVAFAPSLSLAAVNSQNEQTKVIRDSFKKMDYKAGADIGPWLSKNSNNIHYKMRTMLDRLHKSNPNITLPHVEFSDYELNGKSFTKMIFKFDKKQEVIDIHQVGEKIVFSVGGSDFTYEDIYYDGALTAGDLNPMLTLEQLEKANGVNKQAAANYQTKMRDLINALASYSEQAQPEVSKQFSYVDFVLSTAYATESDRTCVIAGNFSEISKKGYCGGEDVNKKNLYCDGPKKSFKCNPLVYGFQDDNKPVCVPFNPQGIPSIYVSQGCNEKFKLNDEASREKFVQSILRNKDKMDVNEEGDFYKNLRSHITQATQKCGISETVLNDHIKNGKTQDFNDDDFLKGFPEHKAKKKDGGTFDYNQGHRTACKFLMNRLLLAKQAADCSQERALASESPSKDEKAKQGKECSVVTVDVVGQKVTNNDDPKKCIELEKQAQQVSADLADGKILLNDPRVQEITEKHSTYVCAFAWAPVAPEAKVAAVAKKPVEKKDTNACTETTTRKWVCAIGAFALLAWLMSRGQGGSRVATAITPVVPVTPTLPPMTVGKGGETQSSTSPNNRPAAAKGTN